MSPSLLESLPTAPGTNDPKWLAELRTKAMSSLKTTGLPTKKTEAWRFTPVQSLSKATFIQAESNPESEIAWAKTQLPETTTDVCYVFVVNGEPVLPQGINDSVSFSLIGEQSGYSSKSKTPFADLNTAMFKHGLVVDIAKDKSVATTIHMVYVGRSTDSETVAYPRTWIRLGQNSKASVMQTYLGAGTKTHLNNAVTDVQVMENATLHHTCVVQPEEASKHILATHITQGPHSNYGFDSALLGGSLSRLDIEVDLEGTGATASLNGIYVTEAGDHTDCHAKVNHLTTHGTSHVNFRGVLTGSSKAIFDAIAVVAKDAQKTSAHQNNRNLILSEGATVHTKPHLEIDADDVKCSHGATIGALDPQQLFYLRSRGMTEAAARAMLTYAFLREAIERIPDPATAQMVSTRALKKCNLDASLNMEEM